MKPLQLPMVQSQSVDSGTGVTLIAYVVDGANVRKDTGALHGKSHEETGIEFTEDAGAAENGRTVVIVWVGVRESFDGRDGYFSVVASPLRIDADARVGYRPATHFTDMIKAIQGEMVLDALTPDMQVRLMRVLADESGEMWENRGDALRDAQWE